ncbi:restriction endonuclease subunit S [Litoreibacter albidus]|uniref:restriction endonuclease subunit S n=1 Tax=Litoreibacter albidus TaxID=670155 RepID=UPI003735856F
MSFGLLGEHAEILSGFAFKSKAFNTDGSGMPLIRIRDVIPGQTSTYYDGPFDERFVVNSGEILIGMDGDFNRARWSSEPALLNQRVCKISAHSKLDEGYLFHLLPQVLQVISDRTPFVTVKHLSAKDLRETEIPLPPLEEQKRIAGILDQADALRRLRTRALDKLNTLGQAIFHEMFGEDLSSQTTVRLGDATSKIGSGATPRGGDSAYKPEGIPLIRSMNVRDGAFSPRGLAFIDADQAAKLNNVVVQGNDVLLNITGASVARVCSAPETMDGARVNQHVAIIRCTDIFLPEFLEAFLLLPSVKAKLLGIAEAGATRQAITKTQIQELEVPDIEMAKQRDFVVRRQAVARQLENMLAQEKAIRNLFASLQHRAFRGEL